jgi:transcriptional regulator with XRE-family HTH domain
MEDYRREVGNRIRRLREAREMSQEDLAHEAGLSTKTISRWENGRHEGGRDNVRKVAKALGVEPGDILGEPPAPFALGLNGDGRGDQLDRIEQKLDNILAILDPNPAGEEVERLSAEVAADESGAAAA